MVFIIVLAVALLLPGTASAAPVAAVLAAATGLTVATATVVVNLVLSVTLNALSAALKKPNDRPSAPGIKTESTQTGDTVPASFIVGRYATAGHLEAPPYSHPNSGSLPNRWLSYVVGLSDVPGVSLRKIFVSGEEVTDRQAHDGSLDHAAKFVDGEPFLYWNFYNGTQVTADRHMIKNYSNHPDRPWSEDMVGSGLAYAVVVFKYNRELYNGLPSVLFEMDGIPLYDPRADATVGGDGQQRWADTSTWETSTNPIVIVYNILRGIDIGGGHIYGSQISAEDLPLGNWFAAMNACDVVVTKSNGSTGPRYQAGLEISVDEEPAGKIEQLLAACSAEIAEVGGVYTVRVGGPGLPVYFFTDDDIAADFEETLMPYPGLDGVHNAIAASYLDPQAVWQAVDAPPLFNAEWEVEDGGRQLMAEVNLETVFDGDQAQDLMAGWINDARRFRQHGLSLPPDALGLEPLDTVSWSSADQGYSAKVFEIGEKSDDLLHCFQALSIRERDANDFVFDPSVDAVVGTVPVATVTIPAPRDVRGFDLEPYSVFDNDNNLRRPALRMVWDPAGFIDGDVFEWQLELAAGRSLGSGTAPVLDSGELILTGGIVSDVSYRARARVVTSGNGPWTSWVYARTDNLSFTAADLGAELFDELNEAAQEAMRPIIEAEAAERDALLALDQIQRDDLALTGLGAELLDRERVDQVNRRVSTINREAHSRMDREKEAVATETLRLEAALKEARASVEVERSARIAGDEAEAIERTTLAVQVAGNQAAVEQEAIARADADSAAAVERASLSSAITDVDGAQQATAASLSGTVTRVSNLESGQTALTQSVSEQGAAISGLEVDVTAQASTLQQHTNEVADIDGRVSAQAQSISSVTTTVGQHSSSIEEISQSVDGISSEYVVRVNADGQFVGFVLAADASDPDAPVFDMTVVAGSFRIVGTDGVVTPFTVYTSSRVLNGITLPPGVYMENVYIGAGFLRDLSVSGRFRSANYTEDANGIPTAGFEIDAESGSAKFFGPVQSRNMVLAEGSFSVSGGYGDGHRFRFVNTGIPVGVNDVRNLTTAQLAATATLRTGSGYDGPVDVFNTFWGARAEVIIGPRIYGFTPGNPQPNVSYRRDPAVLADRPYWSTATDQRIWLNIQLDLIGFPGLFYNPTIDWKVVQIT